MSNAHGMPPYSEVVFYDDTFARLRKPGLLGLLCWLIAHARPLGDGAWVVDTNQEVIAEAIHVGKNTVGPMLDYLHAAGYIHTVPQRGLGRSRGGTSKTHYLTYHPALGRPGDPNTDPEKREPQNGEPKVREPQKRHLYPIPAHNQRPEHPETGNPSDQQMSCLSVDLQTDNNTAPEIPTAVRAELTAIGYDLAAFPLPADTDWRLLMAVIAYARTQHSIRDEARFVYRQIEKGLQQAATEYRLLGADPHHAAGPPPSCPARMDALEYDQLAEQYPEWAAAVNVEAARQAQLLGEPYVRPVLRWQVAATMPRPYSQTTRQPG